MTELQDPTKMYADISTEAMYQDGPGLDSELRDRADLGEDSYTGSGKLTGRRALITGGDSGIGAATAIAFAKEGADIALSYLPDEQSDAERIAEIIKAEGRTAVLLPGDIGDAQHCRDLVTATVDKLGGLDILVINAAKQQFVDDLEDLSDEQFDETLRTNVSAMFWTIKAALPHLQPGSAIIATSSIQAYQPSANLIDYATTKAAINTFCKGLSQQLAPKGIRVNVVAPGPIWTPLQTAGGQPTENLDEFGADTPLGRVGQPAEVAPAMVFLASNESSYVVGETLHVNGGMPSV